jgi:VWFA-related protein
MAAVPGLRAQDPTFTISVNVPLVSVEVIVRDTDGRILSDLTKDDFALYEDGELQDLRFFAPAAAPRSILLLLDTTGSTEPQRAFMFQAVRAFVSTVRPQDRLALGSISDDFRMIMDWSNLERGQQRELRIPRPTGNSRVYESLNRAAGSFGSETGRKGIVVLTDGRDLAVLSETLIRGASLPIEMDKKFAGYAESLRKHSVPVYFVALNTDRNLEFASDEHLFLTDPRFGVATRYPSIGDHYLAAVRTRMERLAEVTGGRIYFPKSLKDLAALYAQIGHDLGVSYSLGYAPADTAQDGTTRRIEVRVRGEGRRVTQSRDEYTPR